MLVLSFEFYLFLSHLREGDSKHYLPVQSAFSPEELPTVPRMLSSLRSPMTVIAFLAAALIPPKVDASQVRSEQKVQLMRPLLSLIILATERAVYTNLIGPVYRKEIIMFRR